VRISTFAEAQAQAAARRQEELLANQKRRKIEEMRTQAIVQSRRIEDAKGRYS